MIFTLGVVVPGWRPSLRQPNLAPPQTRSVTSRRLWRPVRLPGAPPVKLLHWIPMSMRTHYCGEVNEHLVGSTFPSPAGSTAVVITAA